MSLMRSGQRVGITKNELAITKRVRFVIGTWLFVICLGQIASAQSSALRIVVADGEGAVNIIQQKTAVNPIVEVRDRNNLPVSGVAVTFSVGGQGASFAGGASTLTVTTNAAGQAAVAGLTPTATGAITINASAIVNGQTIAATITQTNFATVAEAAASGVSAGGSGAGSAAGAGGATGGGLGTGSIIGIVAGGVAVAGGAAVAGGLNAGDETRVTVSCAFAVTPTAVNVPSAGGTVVITVDASPTGCVTPWNITNNATFVTADRTSGTGSGTVTLTIAANPMPGPLGRSFAVAIAGTVVNFSQLGATSADSKLRRRIRHELGIPALVPAITTGLQDSGCST